MINYTYIYYLTDSNDIPFYVGKANVLNERLEQHKTNFGNNINIHELDIVSTENWVFWEKHYISLFKSWGFKLENKNDGGGGILFHTNETKLKIGNIIKNHPTRNTNISKSNKGISRGKNRKITWDIDFVKRGNSISISKKGKKLSLQHIEALKGKPKNHGNKIKAILNKPVLQLLNGKLIKEHNSITEACIYIGKPKAMGDITNVCKGKKKTAYKYTWQYKH